MGTKQTLFSLGWTLTRDGKWHSHIHHPEADVVFNSAEAALKAEYPPDGKVPEREKVTQ